MDDETYCKFDCLTPTVQQFYTTLKGTNADVLLIETEKFGEKIIIWHAICSCGFKTQPFFIRFSAIFHEWKHELRSLRERMFKKATYAYDPKA